MNTTIPDALPVAAHPAWCDPAACTSYLDFDGLHLLHATADRDAGGATVYGYGLDGDHADVRIDGGDLEGMTPAQARALAAALVAVADAVEGR